MKKANILSVLLYVVIIFTLSCVPNNAGSASDKSSTKPGDPGSGTTTGPGSVTTNSPLSLKPRPASMAQAIYDAICKADSLATHIADKNAAIDAIDTAIKLGAVAQRDLDISAALAGKTHFAGLDLTIIGMLPAIGGGGPVINHAYFATLLTEANDADAKTKLEADLLSSPTNLSTITQAITGQFKNKNWLDTLRVMLKNGAIFDYREALFADYLAAMKAPPSAPASNAWDFHATPLADNKWTLNVNVKTYVENGANWANIININYNNPPLVKHNWSSANTVKVLQNTLLLDNLENAVFKYLANLTGRSDALAGAYTIVNNNALDRLTVPKFALDEKDANNKYLFEERLDMDANWYFQHDLYAYLYEKAKTDTDLNLALTKALEELTTFVCQSNFNDVKFDNNPISKYGTIALIDPESAGPGNGPRRLLVETEEFYTPGDYKDTIKAVIATFQAGGPSQCQNGSYNLATADLNKAKIKADNYQTMMEKVAQCRIKKGVINYEDKVKVDLTNLSIDFQNAAEKVIAETIMTALNDEFTAANKRCFKKNGDFFAYSLSTLMEEKKARKKVFLELVSKDYICGFTGDLGGQFTIPASALGYICF